MPLLRRIESKHVLFILLMFWSAWLYTEITEYSQRSKFTHEVSDFMHKGDRFTQLEGDAVERRLDIIEAQLEAIDLHHMREAHPLEIQSKAE